VPTITPAVHSTHQQISPHSKISNDSESSIVNGKAGENPRCHLPPGNASKALATRRKLTFQSSIHTGSWLSTECALPLMTGTRRVGARSLLRVPANFQPPLLPFQSPQLTEASVFQSSSLHLSSDSLSNTLYLVMGSRVVACAHCLVPRQPSRLHPTFGGWSIVHLAKDFPPPPASLDSTLCSALFGRQRVYAWSRMPIVECTNNL
jgi:hypothetical protein